MKNTILETKCIKTEKLFNLTLNDCLACSGCITEDGKFTEDYTKFANSEPSTYDLIISTYSKIQIYNYFLSENPCTFPEFERQLCGFLRDIKKVGHIVDTSYFQECQLEYILKEFEQNDLTITSECTGVVAYIERAYPHLLVSLSKVQSLQTMAYGYLKLRSGNAIVSVVQCYDKKLENLRDGCSFDYILTVYEFIEYLQAAGFANYHGMPGCCEIEMSKIYYKSASGGYTEYILSKASFKKEIVSGDSNERGGRMKHITSAVYQEKEYSMLKIYGLENALNFFKSQQSAAKYRFVEIFLCKNACTGGPKPLTNNNELLRSFESKLSGDPVGLKFKKREYEAKIYKKIDFKIDW